MLNAHKEGGGAKAVVCHWQPGGDANKDGLVCIKAITGGQPVGVWHRVHVSQQHRRLQSLTKLAEAWVLCSDVWCGLCQHGTRQLTAMHK